MFQLQAYFAAAWMLLLVFAAFHISFHLVLTQDVGPAWYAAALATSPTMIALCWSKLGDARKLGLPLVCALVGTSIATAYLEQPATFYAIVPGFLGTWSYACLCSLPEAGETDSK